MSRVLSFIKSGNDSSAYERCLEDHLERMWHLALRFEVNQSDAEDLLQDLLRRAWRNRSKLLKMENPGAWLTKVLYRLHIDRWRRHKKWQETSSIDDEAFPAYNLEAPATRSGLDSVAYAEIKAFIDELPEPQRTVLLMHDAEGYTLEEISRTQDVPVGTLKSRLHRARAAIRNKFQ